jgi:hypothetical protein
MKPNAHRMLSAAFAADDINFVLRHYIYPLADLLSRIQHVRSIYKFIWVLNECSSRWRLFYLPYATAFSHAKKPSISRGLKDGAGEEGRTPDLMLGKHTL